MLEIRGSVQRQPPQRSCALGTLPFAAHLPLEVRQHLPHPQGTWKSGARAAQASAGKELPSISKCW